MGNLSISVQLPEWIRNTDLVVDNWYSIESMKYLINPLTGSNLIYKCVQNTGLFLVHLEYPFKAQSSTLQYDEYKKILE